MFVPFDDVVYDFRKPETNGSHPEMRIEEDEGRMKREKEDGNGR